MTVQDPCAGHRPLRGLEVVPIGAVCPLCGGVELARHEIHPDNADYEEGVRCVVMPCCGFTYDAIHTNGRGIYSCPLCEHERGSDDR